MGQSTATKAELVAKQVKTIDTIDAWRHVSAYLVNSSGSNNLGVDGSGGAPQTFSYSPPSLYDFLANRVIVYMQTATAMSVDVFGDLGAALGTGIEIKANEILITTWKDNIDIYTETSETSNANTVSDIAVDLTIMGRWTFHEDTNGKGLYIPNGKSFEAIVNDDLSSLTALRIRLKGILIAQANIY